jgi:phosphoribosyl-AMP cyclohydrolase
MPTDIVPTGKAGEVEVLVRYDAAGLVPVIVQDNVSGEVLMFAYANREAVARTVASRAATFYSRSRGGLWVKGETSGHRQTVVEVRLDCDGDCVLYRVVAAGPACHQLRQSCFSNRVDADGSVHCDRPVVPG